MVSDSVIYSLFRFVNPYINILSANLKILKSSKFGFKTIKTPTKPTIIALHLLIPIFSFKKIIAKIDIKKGQEKNNALVIARDIKVKEI